MKAMELTAFKCVKCGNIHYPFHDRCANCMHREFEEIAPEGDAKLLTFTQIFNLPWGFDQRFLIIGVAKFENGVKAMGQIKADSIDNLELGMELAPGWEPVRTQHDEDVYGLVFTPKS